MKFRNALLAATMMALPLAANAQPITGLYIGGGVGGNYLMNEKATIPGGSTHLKAHIGPTGEASVGYGLGNGLRVEVEGDWMYNSFYGTSRSGTPGGGKEQKMGAMLNVLYDVAFVPYVQPYVGIGGGYQWRKEQDLHIGADAALDRTKGDPAGQLILGAAIPIPGAPGLAVTADYRFMALIGSKTYVGTPAGIKLGNDFNHSVLVGFRYNFGQTPPPPPAAPAPMAAAPSPVSRSYLVFFDWDKSALTDRARQIVSEAAANSTKVQYTRLEVNGYTDTSGTASYNQGLSVRRAQAVAAELVKDGVPKSAITIQGFGETHLLVPTGAGVREPQNRRVEIIIK